MHIYHFEYVYLVKGQRAQLEVGNNLNMVLDKGSQYVAMLLNDTDSLIPDLGSLPIGIDILGSISFTATGNPYTYSLPYVENDGDYSIVVISKYDFDRLVSGIQHQEAVETAPDTDTVIVPTQALPVDVGAYVDKTAKAMINPDSKALNLELAKKNKALDQANQALVEKVRKLQADSDLAHIRLRREEGFLYIEPSLEPIKAHKGKHVLVKIPEDMPAFILYGQSIELLMTNTQLPKPDLDQRLVDLGRPVNMCKTVSGAIRTLIKMNSVTRGPEPEWDYGEFRNPLHRDWIKEQCTVRVALGPDTGVEQFVRDYIADKYDFLIFTKTEAKFFNHQLTNRILSFEKETTQGSWWQALRSIPHHRPELIIVTDARHFENFDDGFREMYGSINYQRPMTVLLLG